MTQWLQKNEQTKLPLILCGDIAFSLPIHLPTQAHGYPDRMSTTPHDFIQDTTATTTPTPSCLLGSVLAYWHAKCSASFPAVVVVCGGRGKS